MSFREIYDEFFFLIALKIYLANWVIALIPFMAIDVGRLCGGGVSFPECISGKSKLTTNILPLLLTIDVTSCFKLLLP